MKFHAIVICCFLLCLLAGYGCKTQTVVVPAKQTHQEQNDSIEKHYIHDSIYIDRWHTIEKRGDTTILHDSIFIYRWKYTGDTVYVATLIRDTVPSDPVIIEKPLTNNQIFLQRCGVAFWVLLVIFIIVIAIGIWIKFAK